MDIYRFINSRDIREHLRDINYEFNALEASWLVYQCDEASVEERHKAWTWIIDNMPDMEVIKRPNCKYRKSLHDTLNRYMAMENEYLDIFKDPKDAVYICEYRYDWERSDQAKVFFSLDDCIKDMEENWNDHGEDELKYGTYADVTRHSRDMDRNIEICYDLKCNIISVRNNGIDQNEEYEDLSGSFFDGLWFDFPTPFKKGDIVCMYYYNQNDRRETGFCRGIIVLESILPWYLKEEGESSLKSYIEGKNGDTSDMTVYGYFMFEDGCIYHECTHNYMNLEFYRGSLTDIRRLYKALSNYMKGEIGIDLLLYAHRIIVLEKMREDASVNWYTDEGLRLAGLLEDTDEGIVVYRVS